MECRTWVQLEHCDCDFRDEAQQAPDLAPQLPALQGRSGLVGGVGLTYVMHIGCVSRQGPQKAVSSAIQCFYTGALPRAPVTSANEPSEFDFAHHHVRSQSRQLCASTGHHAQSGGLILRNIRMDALFKQTLDYS